MSDSDQTQPPYLPNDCLEKILKYEGTTKDRNNYSLVSKYWSKLEAETRSRLTLTDAPDLQKRIPILFNRFINLTTLSLHSTNLRGHSIINDSDIVLATSMCPNLTCLQLRDCTAITNAGVYLFSKHYGKLRFFCCDACNFDQVALFALLDNCPQLEALSLKAMCYIQHDAVPQHVTDRAKATRRPLKAFELSTYYGSLFLAPCILSPHTLTSIKLISCWGTLEMFKCFLPEDDQDNTCLLNVHLQYTSLTDDGLSLLARCQCLRDLTLVSNPSCTESGLLTVLESCTRLIRLVIDDGRQLRSKFGDPTLFAVANHSLEMQELVFIGVPATSDGLQNISTSCLKLSSLHLSKSRTITDIELDCLASHCRSLKHFVIEDCCNVSNHGVVALGLGCSELVTIRVSSCRKVTSQIVSSLEAKRGGSLVIKLNTK